MKTYKHCAFQYYNGNSVVCDETFLTIEEAKALFNSFYEDMIQEVEERGNNIEVAIWINMKHKSDYNETLIHLSSPQVKFGNLCELKYYEPFTI